MILGKFHPIQSKSLLALGGLISVLFAYIEAIGLSYYIGIETVGPHSIIPFLLLGIGLDDMFVLVA